MDQVETAEWQQVERFLDMLVSAKSQDNPRSIEQLASAFARHLTVIRQREELRIHSIRQLQSDRQEDESMEEQVKRLRDQLDNQGETSNDQIRELMSELKASEQQAEKAVLEKEDILRQKEALNHAMDVEFAKAQREKEELLSMLHHTEHEQAAVHRLSSSERERDAARLELLEAELSLARNRVKTLEEQVDACKKELDLSEKGRKEALAAATSGREECTKLQQDLWKVTEKCAKLEKERKVYETAARKAAGELVNLRIRESSPPPARDNMALSVNSNISTSLTEVLESAHKFEATMGANLDISVGAQSGSDKATTASDSKGSDKATNSSESPNLDKPVLPIRVATPTTDSESNQNSSPDNTYSAIPPLNEFSEREYKGEQVIRAALELAAIARGKAEKALSMRAEERKEAEIHGSSPSFAGDRMAYSGNRTDDAMADSIPRVSPLNSERRPSSPRLHHPQPQGVMTPFGGQQTPGLLMQSQIASPTASPTAQLRHPSPTPQAVEAASRPFAHSTFPGAPGGTRSMTNLTAGSRTRPTQHGLQDSNMRQTRTPASTSTAVRQQQQQQQFPQRVPAQVGGQKPMTTMRR